MAGPALAPGPLATSGIVLGVDTSTVVNVGLAKNGTVLAAATVDDPMAHAEQLTPLIGRVMAEAQLSLAHVEWIVVGVGPGPFTGLRVGITTARVLAFATGARLRGVCSLDVLAVQSLPQPAPAEFLVATDARRKEVYWARYAPDGARLEGPRVSSPDDLPALPTIGPAAELYPDRLATIPGPRTLDPGVLASAGLSLADAGIEPLYLRRPDTTEPSRRKSVLVPRRERRRR